MHYFNNKRHPSTVPEKNILEEYSRVDALPSFTGEWCGG